MKLHEIENRNELPMAALLEVWESSARAMHHFLSDAGRAVSAAVHEAGVRAEKSVSSATL